LMDYLGHACNAKDAPIRDLFGPGADDRGEKDNVGETGRSN
jgi:hypothetical protein